MDFERERRKNRFCFYIFMEGSVVELWLETWLEKRVFNSTVKTMLVVFVSCCFLDSDSNKFACFKSSNLLD